MNNIEESAGLCALNRIFGYNPRIGHALISHYGSAIEVFRADTSELDELTGPFSRYKGEIGNAAFDHAMKEITELKEKGIEFIGLTDADYPSLLKECPDAPIGLYFRTSGQARDMFSTRRKVGIVGTRDISQYGQEWCRRIVNGLASSPEKPVIISGLALGTDITAHTAALEAGLPTIGVMATGPETIYPYRHRGTAEKMASTPGCGLVTDYPPGTAPLAPHFLRRNRIIAGLAESLILVESKTKGGGIMTSRLAFSYGRNVYALPGRADDIRSQGCNLLIREKIAEPLTDIESMMLEMGFGIRSDRNHINLDDLISHFYSNRLNRNSLTATRTIFNLIRKNRGITIDEIAIQSRLSTAYAISLCTMLESDGLITVDILQRCTLNPRKSELFF